MRRWLACVAVVGLAACGGDASESEPVDTTSAAIEATTTTLDDPTVGEASATYRMVTAFLSQTLASAPGLRRNVTDVEALAACVVNAGYQINGLPPPGYASTQTTLVAPETMIAPMLTYLTETCTGIPSAEWAGE